MDHRLTLLHTCTHAHTLHLSWFVYVVTVSVNITTICYSFPRTLLQFAIHFHIQNVPLFVPYSKRCTTCARSIILCCPIHWRTHSSTMDNTCMINNHADLFEWCVLSVTLCVNCCWFCTLNDFCLCSILRLLFILCALIHNTFTKKFFLLISVKVSWGG